MILKGEINELEKLWDRLTELFKPYPNIEVRLNRDKSKTYNLIIITDNDSVTIGREFD